MNEVDRLASGHSLASQRALYLTCHLKTINLMTKTDFSWKHLENIVEFYRCKINEQDHVCFSRVLEYSLEKKVEGYAPEC